MLENSVVDNSRYIRKRISKKSILNIVYNYSLQLLFWQFNQIEKLETKNIFIDERKYKNLVIYFTSNVLGSLLGSR